MNNIISKAARIMPLNVCFWAQRVVRVLLFIVIADKIKGIIPE